AINNSNEEKTIPISVDEFLPKDGQKDGQGKFHTYLKRYNGNKNEIVESKNGKYLLVLPPKSANAFEGNFATVVQTDE
ncbi:MAG: hypothetical protein M3Q33_15500, partial [Acidobacteriota bacterium]|nr:hypothetical protein [Acidobacteriota bacterium]